VGSKTGLTVQDQLASALFQAALFSTKVCVDEGAASIWAELGAGLPDAGGDAFRRGLMASLRPGKKVTSLYWNFWKVEDGPHHRQLTFHGRFPGCENAQLGVDCWRRGLGSGNDEGRKEARAPVAK